MYAGIGGNRLESSLVKKLLLAKPRLSEDDRGLAGIGLNRLE